MAPSNFRLQPTRNSGAALAVVRRFARSLCRKNVAATVGGRGLN